MRGNAILAAVIAIGLVLVVSFYLMNEAGAYPEIPGITEKVVVADLQAKVWVGGLGSFGVEIVPNSVVTHVKVLPMQIFGAWLPHTELKGVVVAESYRSSVLVDRKYFNVEGWANFWEVTTQTYQIKDLKLGNAGDGRITIKVSLYNQYGVLLDDDQTWVTI
jgi:hypothetical protein